MIFSPKSARRMFPFSVFPILLLSAGIFLMPLVSGCSGKKNQKTAKNVSKKKAAKKRGKGSPKKTAAKKGAPSGKTEAKKTAKPAEIPSVPAVFTRLTSYEGISLEEPFEAGETELLMKIDPAKGIRILTTEKLSEGKLVLDASTLRIIRLETKKQYETEKEAAAAFEKRQEALKKSIDLLPVRSPKVVAFTEMISDGRGRTLKVILSGSTVQEIVTVQAMPSAVVPAGKPIHGVFGLTLGMPAPDNMIDKNAMFQFFPDDRRDEFKTFNYYNDEKGNVQSILVKSDPDRIIGLTEALAVAAWLEEQFAMKMSYDVESTGAGLFRYSSEGRLLELRWQDGKLTLSARISVPDRKK